MCGATLTVCFQAACSYVGKVWSRGQRAEGRGQRADGQKREREQGRKKIWWQRLPVYISDMSVMEHDGFLFMKQKA